MVLITCVLRWVQEEKIWIEAVPRIFILGQWAMHLARRKNNWVKQWEKKFHNAHTTNKCSSLAIQKRALFRYECVGAAY